MKKIGIGCAAVFAVIAIACAGGAPSKGDGCDRKGSSSTHNGKTLHCEYDPTKGNTWQ